MKQQGAVEERVVCSRCGEHRPVSAFHHSSTRGRQAWCKSCRKEYDASYWQKTRHTRVQFRRRRQAELESWHRSLKESTPCADCRGHFHHAAMHWDHLPGESKRLEVSTLVHRGARRAAVHEMTKCELVCANCHAVRTYERVRGVAQPGRAPVLGTGGSVGSNPTTPIFPCRSATSPSVQITTVPISR